MPDLDALKAEAKRVLNEGIVEIVIGFKAGDTPLHPQPAFFRSAAEVDQLVYGALCQNNLATYLTRQPKTQKIGMLVRGCENRSVNALAFEGQHARENLYLIGIPCEGIIDWRKIVDQTGEEVISVVEQSDNTVLVEAKSGYYTLEKASVLHESCARCIHQNPVSADVVIGVPLPEGNPAMAREKVEAFAGLPTQERTAWFRQEAERCIRCYACREACPMCYCEECFVDHITPRWTESGTTPAGMQGWHIVRAFHQTGRCTSCGACERACPMDIKMTYLTEKLNDDMRQKYGFEVGMDPTVPPPFSTVTLDDKSRFVI
ncbi:MAG: 4Fe-4S dicluster domain-containing protein [Anaerolineaceae bacterium]|nr:4Fe-4S dicluster domain-containing protein [Anaerolineaceae bacterium]